ncbi:1-phosphofructokinase [uncultured Clostridium sp.]|uniref:1-phosphofructokinase n=1 Tax=uncultured Clostridium sp. TaxID=59620 RepID=UPI002608CFC8|nr:1-phosphofructokinase [uncultured Clostridium sp.]
MILVVNLNASVDKKYEMINLNKGSVMRVRRVENTPGGKGIHVANVATILDEECLVTGFLGGKTGEFIEESLENYGIKSDFIKIKGETRECLAIITDDSTQTEILEPGPVIDENEQVRFIEKFNKLSEIANIIVISGSVPQNIKTTFYKDLIEIANKKNKKVLLDTSGFLLNEGIKGKPYFIKPNKDEIEALTGRKIESINDAINEVKYFQNKGIEFVIISLGEEGSIAGFNKKIYKVSVPKVNAVNPVGSGDSYVAGIAIGLARNYDIKDMLKLASACGTANAMENETGCVKKEVVNKLVNKITIELLAEK